jgi:hypothetical protein
MAATTAASPPWARPLFYRALSSNFTVILEESLVGHGGDRRRLPALRAALILQSVKESFYSD